MTAMSPPRQLASGKYRALDPLVRALLSTFESSRLSPLERATLSAIHETGDTGLGPSRCGAAACPAGDIGLRAKAEKAMTTRGRKDPDPAVKARAELLFERREQQKREGETAMDEYLTKQEAARARMAKLREQRLAAEAKAAGERKARRQPRSQEKR